MLEAFSGGSELIFIDDASCDGSYDILKRLAGADKRVRVFRFNSNQGQCKALEKGFRESRGEIIAQKLRPFIENQKKTSIKPLD